MPARRPTRLRLEPLEARDTPALVLVPDGTLADLRQEAATHTPQWEEFRARLDGRLTEIVSVGDYQGAALAWIADYALGYQVLKTADPSAAARYADKALALVRSGLHDYQKGGSVTRQFLALGDGSTRAFTLPHADIRPESFRVYLGKVTTKAVVRGPADTADVVAAETSFLRVGPTRTGPFTFAEGDDWRRSPDRAAGTIDWSPAGAEPRPGSTYYVAVTSGIDAAEVPTDRYAFDGTAVRFRTPPAANRAVFVEYVYGANAPPGSGMAYQQTSAGDGGFNSVLIDRSYTSRYLGKYLALGYDWLSDYAGYSAALKAETAGLLVRWSDYVRDFGYYADSPASNYGAGGYVSRMLTAAALANQGDPAAGRLLAEMAAYRTDHLVPLVAGPEGSLRGGFWPEGWNYGDLAAQNVLLAGLAYEQAGLGSATAERQWATEVIRHLLAAQPTPDTVYNGGDWFAYPAPFPGKELFYLLAELTPNPAARGQANRVIQTYPGPQTADALDLLFRDPAAPAADGSDTPREHLAEGTGLVTARADGNLDSTWVSFQLGNSAAADHQSYTPGQLQLQRGPDALLDNAPLVLNRQTGVQQSSLGNSVVIDDTGDGLQTYRFSMGDWYGYPGVRLTAYEPTAGYVYAAGDYRAAYSRPDDPGGGGPATELTRQVAYLRPDFVVVHDRVGTVKAAYPKELRWHHTAPATVSGNAWTESVGSSKLFGRTFSSEPLTTTATTIRNGTAAVYRVTTKPANPVKDVRYVTALQTAPASVPGMAATRRVVTADGRMEGVQMADEVVLFGTDARVDLSAAGVTYEVSGAGSVTHLLTDLAPGATYAITADGSSLGAYTASTQGTITFATPAGARAVAVALTKAVPVARPDFFVVPHDEALAVSPPAGVLANDGPSGGPLAAELVTGPTHGSVELGNDGSFTYTPEPGFTGTDTFTYRATDGADPSPPATVAIAVRNSAPGTSEDSYAATLDQSLVVDAAAGLLANDADGDGDGFAVALADPPAHGTVTASADGSFMYTPDPGFSGTDSFTYRASDGATASPPTMVIVTVRDPVLRARPDAYAVRRDHALSLVSSAGLLANDNSPTGQKLRAVLVTRPAHGRLILQPSGAFVYRPVPGFVGTDTFEYRVRLGTLESAVVQVTLTVLP